MADRPNYIDLRSKSHNGFGHDTPTPRSFSPALLHVAGERPPELSPLDAFAAQSRLLAKQLEESMNGGNRLSRLPPLTIDSLNNGRPGYFRSLSERPPPSAPKSPPSPVSGERTEVEVPGIRPVSVHPLVSGPILSQGFVPPLPSPSPHLNSHHENRGRRPPTPVEDTGYFGARREQSPPSMEPRHPKRGEPSPRNVQTQPSVEAIRQRTQLARGGNDGALGISGYDPRALAPPRSPFAQRSPSPRSMSNDSSDDDYINATSRTGMSPNRKLSTESSFSSTPISPGMYSMGRSSSISSEASLGGTRLPRPSFNFSRPISRASLIGQPVEVPTRQASGDSQPSFVLADDTAHTPVSMHSDGFPEQPSDAAAPSYTYSKFSLPRGKMLQRNSAIFQEGLPQAQITWETPVPFSNVQTLHGDAPPSPPSRPSTSSIQSDHPYSRPSLDPGRPSYEFSRPSLDPGRPSLDPGRPTHDHNSIERPSSPSEASSAATIKAKSQHSVATSAEWSAEEHVTKAIEYHEAGILNKSTYHLRLAARMNHPTGMLLYALACRHGWGMRPNQREGVAWLRKAADAVSLEVADDEDMMKEGKAVDIVELKARKAQFALSVYELGVSHMNGWGIEQDKALALRCFEIAGSWGDADALAEAGFCYAQGVGCKKDLKKSAQFYRQAEAKGISMIGNSWIYKSKYNDGADDNKSKKSSDTQRRGRVSTDTNYSPKSKGEKKHRDKSRSRNFFGRSKTPN